MSEWRVGPLAPHRTTPPYCRSFQMLLLSSQRKELVETYILFSMSFLSLSLSTESNCRPPFMSLDDAQTEYKNLSKGGEGDDRRQRHHHTPPFYSYSLQSHQLFRAATIDRSRGKQKQKKKR